MKKIILLIITAVSLLLVGCESTSAKEQAAQQAKEQAEQTWHELTDIGNLVFGFAYDMKAAWDWVKSTGELEERFNATISHAGKKLGGELSISGEEWAAAYHTFWWNDQYINDLECVIKAVKVVYTNNGTFNNIEERLNAAKENVQQIKGLNPEAAYIQDLTEYYLLVSKFNLYVQNFAGNYSTFISEINNNYLELQKLSDKLSLDL